MSYVFGSTLKKLRLQRNLTQKQLADTLHLAESTISMYETGDRDPSFEVIELIADYFNVSIDALYGRPSSELYNDFISNSELTPQLLKENAPSLSEYNNISEKYLRFAQKLEEIKLTAESLELIMEFALNLKKQK